MLFLGLPLAAYVDINSSPFEKGSWRFTGASLAANLITSAIALAILAVIGMPEIYLEKPSLILIPPEVAGYLGIHIEVSFIQSLIVWIFLMNLFGAVFNSLPLLITDGYYVLISTLRSITGRDTAKPVFIFSMLLLFSISTTLLVERVIIPYL
jgi:membrane-associated protease RseP (regulator of RpoE activity)